MSDTTASEPARPFIDPRFGLMFLAADQLIPLFQTRHIDRHLAQEMATSAIEAYQPETRADYVNVARTIAFSMTALALLGSAAAEDMTMAQKLRVFGRANALNRSADQSERAMMQRRRYHQTNPPAEQPDHSVADTANDAAELEAAIGNVMKEYMAVRPAVSIPPAPASTSAHATRPTPPSAQQPVSAIHYNGPESVTSQPQSAPYKAGLLQTSMLHRGSDPAPNPYPR